MTRGGRRFGLALSLALILAPALAEPQPSTKITRIGYLSSGVARSPYVEAIQEGLRELGCPRQRCSRDRTARRRGRS